MFDEVSPENSGCPTIYIFDEVKHADVYSESYALERYGAFWMDFMFTAKGIENNSEGRYLITKSNLENIGNSPEAYLDLSVVNFSNESAL